MTYKPLFARSLAADPDRLHFAAHSHHLWPDASYSGQLEAWDDAARLADRKWGRVVAHIWPEAKRHIADELGTSSPDSIAVSANTHDFLVRLMSACPRSAGKIRVLTSDGEFHSARRQFARWSQDCWFELEQVPVEPFGSFRERFLERARSGDHDLMFVSQVMFSSGRLFDGVQELASLAQPGGPWVVIDGYHAFMAIEAPFGAEPAGSAFYLGGGYKYAMAGEGCAFLHAPGGFGPRPAVTGWFAEFEDLTLPPGSIGYAPDGRRFLGATFDPSALYRFNAVRRMLADHGLDTKRISAHCRRLQEQFVASLATAPLCEAELLNPLGGESHARFLAFRDDRAQQWNEALLAANCITDVRGDVLRIGFAIYHDGDDVERLLGELRKLR